ncbi:lipolytic protein G-D-S-L family [Cyanobacterium stanieri PCC 7202]|uniref:Lipolytic protein G-D-S-L family n=1 Tax=Cyanobacterium stanieri (strain ATCC 29140 / PCC 7202) TaxID=292563 RepID=K9YKP4_CYASC|nr:lipolytic protein G-D-S-L family [Cyanobacterium stanieri PCC 7202]
MNFNRKSFLVGGVIIVVLLIVLGLWMNRRNSLVEENTRPENPRTQIGKSHLRGRYATRVEEFKQLPPVENLIIFLGDSLTQQGRWSRLLADYTDKPIYNLGIGGDTTNGILQRINTVIDLQPDQLFLSIGINDFGNEGKTVDEILTNYRLILDELDSGIAHKNIYIQSLLPVNNQEYPFIDNQDIMAFNEKLRQLASEFDFEYLDLHSQFINSENQLKLDYTNDGLHLNNEGYTQWQRVVVQYVDFSND